jgi:mevalonate kinase
MNFVEPNDLEELMTKAIGSGFGKVILFNEHFVVYGIPAIASAIDSKTETVIERIFDPTMLKPSGNEGAIAGDGWILEDARPANPGYKAKKIEQQKKSIDLVLKAMGFNAKKNNIRITLAGDLKAVGGVGASAAVCVSIARALNNEFKLGLDDKRINEIAYEGETAYAGTPSGIDNTASTYGGLLWFVKNLAGGENTMELIKMKKPLRIVMGNTFVTTDTEAAVAGVRKRKLENPKRYEEIFGRAKELVFEARKAVEAYDTEKIGTLMNENHKLLQQIEVSHPRLDLLVTIALENGAVGAKMTGGGLGGYMVALTPEKEVQDKVAKAVEAIGFEALRTKIGVKNK